MEAWRHADTLFRKATPQIVADPQAAWDSTASLAARDAALLRFWDSRVPGSGAPECLMAAALQSLENKGFALPDYRSLLAEGLAAVAARDMERLTVVDAGLRALMRAARPDPAHPSQRTRRFTGWSEFERSVTWPADIPVDVHTESFADRIAAGWQAQLVGAAVGTAIEGYTAAALQAAFGPIDRYVRPPDTYNDDITFELAFLDTYAALGPELSSGDIGERWLALIPEAWSAEAIALDNLRAGLRPPETARHANPFDEWIGAQMRGAICGMVAPGRAREAARLAWLDAAISHDGNGILGEVFNAVLTARGFVEPDVRRNLIDTVALFPAETEYGAVLRFALDAARSEPDWRSAWARCDTQFVRYNWIHAYPNAAAELVALWCGDGDFDTTLRIGGGIGHDADCNLAQMLCCLGVSQGTQAIARRWTAPLGDTIVTTMRRPARIALGQLVDWTLDAVRRWMAAPAQRRHCAGQSEAGGTA